MRAFRPFISLHCSSSALARADAHDGTSPGAIRRNRRSLPPTRTARRFGVVAHHHFIHDFYQIFRNHRFIAGIAPRLTGISAFSRPRQHSSIISLKLPRAARSLRDSRSRMTAKSARHSISMTEYGAARPRPRSTTVEYRNSAPMLEATGTGFVERHAASSRCCTVRQPSRSLACAPTPSRLRRFCYISPDVAALLDDLAHAVLKRHRFQHHRQ